MEMRINVIIVWGRRGGGPDRWRTGPLETANIAASVVGFILWAFFSDMHGQGKCRMMAYIEVGP